jgi:trehalose 6-phosphate synthase/phosphatase
VVKGYVSSTRRLVVLGYNATLTTAVEAPRQPKRHFDQIKALTRVNPRIMRGLEVRARGAMLEAGARAVWQAIRGGHA